MAPIETVTVTETSVDELRTCAIEAYLYAYPLTSIEITRRAATRPDAEQPLRGLVDFAISGAPMNRLARVPILPDPSFTDVVRPNVDTLYTMMFFDVAAEPLLVSVPDMGERYHLFQVMEAWTEVVASPGTRTLPDAHGFRFALLGPAWTGELPEDVIAVRLGTDGGWMVGRIQVDGEDDLPAVRAIQQQVRVEPLSALTGADPGHRTPFPTPAVPGDLTVSEHLHSLTAQGFWDLFAGSLSHDQPRAADAEFLARMEPFGWSPTERFDLAALPATQQRVWQEAWTAAVELVETATVGEEIDGWQFSREGIGSYGTDYRTRAVVAYHGLGANLPQDAVYPLTMDTGTGEPLDAANSYVLHLPTPPPVDAFWSLTMYDEAGFFVENDLDRYALRGEQVQAGTDGSVELHLRPTDPGGDLTTNWLPAPESGPFNVMLRLYHPQQEVLDGTWEPTGVRLTP